MPRYAHLVPICIQNGRLMGFTNLNGSGKLARVNLVKQSGYEELPFPWVSPTCTLMFRGGPRYEPGTTYNTKHRHGRLLIAAKTEDGPVITYDNVKVDDDNPIVIVGNPYVTDVPAGSGSWLTRSTRQVKSSSPSGFNSVTHVNKMYVHITKDVCINIIGRTDGYNGTDLFAVKSVTVYPYTTYLSIEPTPTKASGTHEWKIGSVYNGTGLIVTQNSNYAYYYGTSFPHSREESGIAQIQTKNSGQIVTLVSVPTTIDTDGPLTQLKVVHAAFSPIPDCVAIGAKASWTDVPAFEFPLTISNASKSVVSSLHPNSVDVYDGIPTVALTRLSIYRRDLNIILEQNITLSGLCYDATLQSLYCYEGLDYTVGGYKYIRSPGYVSDTNFWALAPYVKPLSWTATINGKTYKVLTARRTWPVREGFTRITRGDFILEKPLEEPVPDDGMITAVFQIRVPYTNAVYMPQLVNETGLAIRCGDGSLIWARDAVYRPANSNFSRYVEVISGHSVPPGRYISGTENTSYYITDTTGSSVEFKNLPVRNETSPTSLKIEINNRSAQGVICRVNQHSIPVRRASYEYTTREFYRPGLLAGRTPLAEADRYFFVVGPSRYESRYLFFPAAAVQSVSQDVITLADENIPIGDAVYDPITGKTVSVASSLERAQWRCEGYLQRWFAMDYSYIYTDGIDMDALQYYPPWREGDVVWFCPDSRYSTPHILMDPIVVTGRTGNKLLLKRSPLAGEFRFVGCDYYSAQQALTSAYCAVPEDLYNAGDFVTRPPMHPIFSRFTLVNDKTFKVRIEKGTDVTPGVYDITEYTYVSVPGYNGTFWIYKLDRPLASKDIWDKSIEGTVWCEKWQRYAASQYCYYRGTVINGYWNSDTQRLTLPGYAGKKPGDQLLALDTEDTDVHHIAEFDNSTARLSPGFGFSSRSVRVTVFNRPTKRMMGRIYENSFDRLYSAVKSLTVSFDGFAGTPWTALNGRSMTVNSIGCINRSSWSYGDRASFTSGDWTFYVDVWLHAQNATAHSGVPIYSGVKDLLRVRVTAHRSTPAPAVSNAWDACCIIDRRYSNLPWNCFYARRPDLAYGSGQYWPTTYGTTRITAIEFQDDVPSDF